MLGWSTFLAYLEVNLNNEERISLSSWEVRVVKTIRPHNPCRSTEKSLSDLSIDPDLLANHPKELSSVTKNKFLG